MKKLNNIFKMIFVFGIIILIGIAGKSDNEVIHISVLINKCIFALSLITLGYIGSKATVACKNLRIKEKRPKSRKHILSNVA